MIALAVLTYGMLAAVGALVALARGQSPLSTESVLGWSGATAALVSALVGAAVAVATVVGTRAMVARYAWARALGEDLRPAARRLPGTRGVLVAALASG